MSSSKRLTKNKKYKPKPPPESEIRRRFYHKGPISEIYRLFVKPFLTRYTLSVFESQFSEGTAAFFGTEKTDVYFTKVKERFKHPGTKWTSPRTPYRLTTGVRREFLNVGTPITVRINYALALRYAELEINDGTTYVANELEYNEIKTKLEFLT